ncbi:MAG: DUF1302 family protein [Pseudomonadota bacterium]
MKFSQQRRRISHAVAVSLMMLAVAGPASALEFDVFGTELKIDSLLTAGVLVRTEERDPSLIAKSNLQPGICVARTAPLTTRGNNSFTGDTCTTSVLLSNTNYVNRPGSFNINGDNGNLNFDQFSLANAAIKLTSDITFTIADFNFFFRPIGIFDGIYYSLEEQHPDTTLQAATSDFPDVAKRRLGFKPGLLDYSVSTTFDIGGFEISAKVGNQVLNWGESAFLALNSLNTINAGDATRLRVPGFDVKELFQPQGMALIGFDVIENVHADFFLQYQWKPAIVDPVGSFFSVSDTLGEGGRYAMLSFGKAPEDPDNLYMAVDNAGGTPPPPVGSTPGDPLRTVGSIAGRTIYRDPNLEKEGAGYRPDEYGFDQFGVAVKTFLPDFNNGTEVSFYAAKYHSRIPSVSLISSDLGCIPDDTGSPATNVPALFAACQIVPNTSSVDFLPVDTAKLVVEYPKDIYMLGTSFNTTVGDFALSGEYVFRPNLPVQIHTVDLTLAAVAPAFPNEDFNIGASVLPSSRSATPDFVSVYRGIKNRPGSTSFGYGPNEYIQGYERLKVGQAGLTLLKTVGGDNFINASQITLLLETGLTHVVDMPDLGDIQFQGAETNTHASHGADGTVGLSPRDLTGQNAVADDGDTCASTSTPKTSAEDVNPRCLRQNPTAQRKEDFGSEFSYGYRAIFLPRYDSLIFGANVEILTGFFHDVSGVAPGLGQNFVGGRKNVLFGVRFDYLSRFIGEIRHTWMFGTTRDSLRDRDNLLVTVGYQF